VKGGFLLGEVHHENGMPGIKFKHCDVDGKVVHEEVFISNNIRKN
jgi:hypothetical protein